MEIKQIREMLDVNGIVIVEFVDNDKITVSTHGKTKIDSNVASELGNKVKKLIGFPKESCQSKPLERKCKNCDYHTVDWGMYTFNGWTGDGRKGYCNVEPDPVNRRGEDRACRYFEPNR